MSSALFTLFPANRSWHSESLNLVYILLPVFFLLGTYILFEFSLKKHRPVCRRLLFEHWPFRDLAHILVVFILICPNNYFEALYYTCLYYTYVEFPRFYLLHHSITYIDSFVVDKTKCSKTVSLWLTAECFPCNGTPAPFSNIQRFK